MSIDADLCAYHAQRRLQTQRGSETAATELLACVSDFSDAASVNRFLGNLVKQVTLKRIPRRDAVTLAYICQLLLNSLGGSIERSACVWKNRDFRNCKPRSGLPRSFGIFPGRHTNRPIRSRPLWRKKRATMKAAAHKVRISISIYSLPAKPDGSRGNCAIFGIAAPLCGTPFSAVSQRWGELARADASFQLTEDHTQ